MGFNLKSFAAGVIVATIGVTSVFAAGAIKSAEFNSNKVVFDGKEIDMTASPMLSVVLEGETAFSNYMPLRAVLEAMGYTIEWEAETSTVLINSAAKAEEPAAEQEEADEIVGAYTEDRALTEDDIAIFTEVTKDLTGVSYEPTLVATQVVSGLNYRFTTTATPVEPDAEPYEAFVYVYKPLGDAPAEIMEITKVKDE